MLYIWTWQVFSAKGQTVHISGFRAIESQLQLFSSAIVCESSHRQYANTWMWLCANKALFVKTDAVWTWPPAAVRPPLLYVIPDKVADPAGCPQAGSRGVMRTSCAHLFATLHSVTCW